MQSKKINSCPWLDIESCADTMTFDHFPVALLLRAAAAAQLKYTTGHARAAGLSVPEWRLLGRLHESAPMQLAELCRVVGVDKAYAGRILRRLTSRGLTTTEPDQNHGRRQIVHITPAGHRLARQIMPVARRSQVQLLQTLTPQERTTLYGVLIRLIEAGRDSPSS